MPTDAAVAKFLYTIMKQLDLKSIDWNAVADELRITNGHAARMRYSRFKKQMEDDGTAPKQAKVPGQRKRKEKPDTGGEPPKKRKKDEKPQVDTKTLGASEAMTGVERSTPAVKKEPAAKDEALVKPEQDVKEKVLDPALETYPVVRPALHIKTEPANPASGSTAAQRDSPELIVLDPALESDLPVTSDLSIKTERLNLGSGSQFSPLDAAKAIMRMSGSPVVPGGIWKSATNMPDIEDQPDALPDFFSSKEEIQAMKEHEEAILGPQTASQKPGKKILIELRD
ncbi:MAG: hypothetical protein Q9208_005449 [Pyrenodesmia sp. 3 TL-2023]